MSDFFFWVTYVALWLLVIVLAAAVFFLYRHLGLMLLNSREGRAAQGPELYERLPSVRVNDINGTMVQLGQSSSRPLFIFLVRHRASRARMCGKPLELSLKNIKRNWRRCLCARGTGRKSSSSRRTWRTPFGLCLTLEMTY